MDKGLPSKATCKKLSYRLEYVLNMIPIIKDSRILTINRLVDTHVDTVRDPLSKLRVSSRKLCMNR